MTRITALIAASKRFARSWRGAFLRAKLDDLIEDYLPLLTSRDIRGVREELVHRGEGAQ